MGGLFLWVCALLIVRLATHFADGFAEPNHLASVAILVVVPYVQHNVFAVFGYDGGRAVENRGAGVAHQIRRHQLVAERELNLLNQIAVQSSLLHELVYFFFGSGMVYR